MTNNSREFLIDHSEEDFGDVDFDEMPDVLEAINFLSHTVIDNDEAGRLQHRDTALKDIHSDFILVMEGKVQLNNRGALSPDLASELNEVMEAHTKAHPLMEEEGYTFEGVPDEDL